LASSVDVGRTGRNNSASTDSAPRRLVIRYGNEIRKWMTSRSPLGQFCNKCGTHLIGQDFDPAKAMMVNVCLCVVHVELRTLTTVKTDASDPGFALRLLVALPDQVRDPLRSETMSSTRSTVMAGCLTERRMSLRTSPTCLARPSTSPSAPRTTSTRLRRTSARATARRSRSPCSASLWRRSICATADVPSASGWVSLVSATTCVLTGLLEWRTLGVPWTPQRVLSPERGRTA
jgi:hypothetical protein